MAEIFPFAAYRYNPERVKLAEVVTQPYDKITPTMQESYAKIPYNLISVEKGKTVPDDSPDNNVYTRAEKALEDWIGRGVLVRDTFPGIYVYFQEYVVPGSAERRTRKGFIALGRLEDYSAGIIFRHEQTLSGPKADRLELLRHTRTHTGQLFMLYHDSERRIDALLDSAVHDREALVARDEYGVVHRLWPLLQGDSAAGAKAGEIVAAIVREMQDKKLVIADGHHRYETALAYRNECRARARGPAGDLGGADGPEDAPYEKAMMAFFNTQAEGLLILPTHRVIRNLPGFNAAAFRRKIAGWFDQQVYPLGGDVAGTDTCERLVCDLAAHGREGRTIGMCAAGEFTVLQLRRDADLARLMPGVSPAQRQLDVVLLHQVLIERGLGITPAAVTAEQNISYERDLRAAIGAVDQGRAQISFLLNAVGVDQVMHMALAGEVLPQKSTDFYPKLLSGLTLYRME